jgi:hypothetical protein
MLNLIEGMMTEEDFLQHMSTLTDDELAHFGVKGMRWGVKRGDNSLNTHTSADAARYNKIAKRLQTKGVNNLSNDDLAKLNKRNQLLSEYRKNNPSKIERGAKATKRAITVLKAAGTLITVAGLAVAGGKAVVSAYRGGLTPSSVANVGASAVMEVIKRL